MGIHRSDMCTKCNTGEHGAGGVVSYLIHTAWSAVGMASGHVEDERISMPQKGLWISPPKAFKVGVTHGSI
jgi:hypothetical protein